MMDNRWIVKRSLNGIPIGWSTRMHRKFFAIHSDHNPMVFELCPACAQLQDCSDSLPPSACPRCHGTQTTGKLISCFQNDAPVIAISGDADGWVKCPACGTTFTTRDEYAWTGWRHIGRKGPCGQKLEIRPRAVRPEERPRS